MARRRDDEVGGMSAVTLFVDARDRTLDSTRPVADLLAVRDGVLVAVGGHDDVLRVAGRLVRPSPDRGEARRGACVRPWGRGVRHFA